MSEELNSLDYKFGLESLESACPSVEKIQERVPNVIASMSPESRVMTSPQAVSPATSWTPSAIASRPAPVVNGVAVLSAQSAAIPLPEMPVATMSPPAANQITQSSSRNRVVPSAPVEETNDLIAAFTSAETRRGSIEEDQTMALEENSSYSSALLELAPHSVAGYPEAKQAFHFDDSREEKKAPLFKTTGSMTVPEVRRELLPVSSSATRIPVVSLKDEVREQREQEKRALFSFKRGIKVFSILGGALLMLLVFESTKHSMYGAVAETAASLGASSVALSIFDADMAKDKAGVAHLIGWATKDQSRGRIKNAVAYYTRAISLESKDYVLYLNRGVLNFELHDAKAAISDASKAIALNPTCALAYFNRGLAYKYEDNYKPAIADFTKAIALSGAQPHATFWLHRGECYLLLKHNKEAFQDLDVAIKHGSEPAKALKDLALAQAKHTHRLEARSNAGHRRHI